MSQFKEEDRNRFKQDILRVGEQYFNELGLKKTTADMIAKRVGIGKGTFCHFYRNKESLFLELYLQKQQKLFAVANEYLQSNASLPAREKCYQVMHIVVDGFYKSPILGMTDTSLWGKIAHKVPREMLTANDTEDRRFFEGLINNGITFKYPVDIIIDLIQLSCMNAIMLKHKKSGEEKVDILLRGTILYLVEDKDEKMH